jgi:FkbM family methyltransferase
MIEPPGAHLITFHGCELRFGPCEPPTFRSVWDHGELAHACRTFYPGFPILNAGAGMGYVAAMLAATFGSANVLSYEPHPELARFARTVEVDGQPLRIEHGALWLRDEPVQFRIYENWSSGTIDTARGARAPVSIEVPGHDINRILSSKAAWNVLLDIEGAEHELLPAMDLRRVAALVVEMHPTTPERWKRTRSAVRDMLTILIDAPDPERTSILVARG